MDQAKRKHLQLALRLAFGLLFQMQCHLSVPLLDLAWRRPHVLFPAGERHCPAVPAFGHCCQRRDPRQPPGVRHLATPTPTSTITITSTTSAAAAAAAAWALRD